MKIYHSTTLINHPKNTQPHESSNFSAHGLVKNHVKRKKYNKSTLIFRVESEVNLWVSTFITWVVNKLQKNKCLALFLNIEETITWKRNYNCFMFRWMVKLHQMQSRTTKVFHNVKITILILALSYQLKRQKDHLK